jgi:hypothetical protein
MRKGGLNVTKGGSGCREGGEIRRRVMGRVTRRRKCVED